MNLLKSFFWPGYLDWADGQKGKSLLWLLPWLVLTVVIELMYGGFSGSFCSFYITVSVCFYLLSGFVSYVDYGLKVKNQELSSKKEVKKESEKYDHKAWETILSWYMRSEYSQAMTLIDEQLQRNKKDPFPHFIIARILAKKGERKGALKSLKRCQKLDKKKYLSYECEQLIISTQLEK